MTRKQRPVDEQITTWNTAFILWAKALKKLSDKLEILQENPGYCYSALNLWFLACLNGSKIARFKVESDMVYKILKKNFVDAKDDFSLMLPFIFSAVDSEQKKVIEAQQRFTARVDIKLVPETEDANFKIVSVSDDKADVLKPDWMQKGGIGYQIQSYAGKLEIVAKATADGQIKLELKGLDVRDTKDNSKRVPYWLDYSNLTINGKIFDKPTPAWHDKPYRYTLNVKAGEEIKLQVLWLPHGNNAKSVSKAEESVGLIAGKFLPDLTARLDMRLRTEEQGDLQLLFMSDDEADIKKPGWLQKGSSGYQIHSQAGNIKIVTQANANGQFRLELRGSDVRDPKDKSKRLPCWIDYTSLTINEKKILNKLL